MTIPSVNSNTSPALIWRRLVGHRRQVKSPGFAFTNMLEFAREIASKNPAALVDVMRLFLRSLQTDLLMSSAERELHAGRQSVEPLSFFAPNGPHSLQHYWNHPRLDESRFQVDLARDPVLPCPWHRDRYIDAISTIGTGKPSGEWQRDPNHGIVLWLPWGIPFVTGGNHSIAAGVLAGEGVMAPNEVWDLSAWLEIFETDGLTFFHRSDKTRVCAVADPVRAAIFEVGRIMHGSGVVPMRS